MNGTGLSVVLTMSDSIESADIMETPVGYHVIVEPQNATGESVAESLMATVILFFDIIEERRETFVGEVYVDVTYRNEPVFTTIFNRTDANRFHQDDWGVITIVSRSLENPIIHNETLNQQLWNETNAQ